jgi:hypothetical protein
MSETPREDTLEKRTREVLEESTARIDGRTLSRLTQARHAALGQLQRPLRQRWYAWLPAGVAAAVAVLAVVMWSGTDQKADPLTVNETQLDDLEIVADADAPDFADGEDLEFYEWAASEAANGELES